MGDNYAPDTFTENEVLACLEAAGLKHKRGHRYILTQCPTHDDKQPSAQIYKDDWFVNCHSGCGRFHITKAFPELRPNGQATGVTSGVRHTFREVKEVKYQEYELRDYWAGLPVIPREHKFKGIPLDILDSLGWRWEGQMNSYFIPYFDTNKHFIPFAQHRHLQGERRFTFLKDAKPIAYGLWNLDNPKLFLVEGASDAAVLDYAAVPWIAVPSAASNELTKALAHYCDKNAIELVYAGDNDAAGDKVRESLDEAGVGYRVKQPPKIYKDWGDFLEAQGIEAVQEYCFPELEMVEVPETDLERVQKFFPGAKPMRMVDDDGLEVGPKEIVRSNQSVEPTVLF